MFSKLKEETTREKMMIADIIAFLINIGTINPTDKEIEEFNRRIVDFQQNNSKITLDNLFQ